MTSDDQLDAGELPDASFFVTDGERFVASDYARGPWNPEACHAGPPTGLLARAAEQLVPDKQLVRITVELIRPVPMAGFRIRAAIEHDGRQVVTTATHLEDEDGQVRVRAKGLHLAPTADEHEFPTVSIDTPPLAHSRPGGFPIATTLHGLTGFRSGVSMRYPPGQDRRPGPTTAWMRTIPLLAGEEPSPFQRICPLADSGNAIGRNAEPDEVGFVNPDLTVVLHRPPEGLWLGSEAVSFWQPTGIGLADALLFDHRGTVGRALQTLLLRPMKS